MADDDKAKLVLDPQVPPTGEQKGLNGENDEVSFEFQKLKGSSQERFSQMISQRNKAFEERDQALKRLEEMESRISAPQPIQGVNPVEPAQAVTPEQQEAIQNLRSFGIATKEDLQALQDQLILDAEYSRLEQRWSGEDGGPKFSRVEVESYMKKTGIYNPEKAFEDLYRDELYDLRTRQGEQTTSRTYTEKPVGSGLSRTEPLTAESLRERLSRPDGMQWWDKNRERILPLLGQLVQ